ncbi:hypothetical protein Dimus_030973 [Dionaea muscipula]
MIRLWLRLKQLQKPLKKLHHRDFSGLSARIEEATKQLECCHQKLRWRTKARLYDMGLISDPGCVLCHGNEESVDHLLFACDFSQAVMRVVLRAVKLPPPRTSWRQWMVRVTRGKTSLAKQRRKCLGEFVYFLWQERNCRVFKFRVLLQLR